MVAINRLDESWRRPSDSQAFETDVEYSKTAAQDTEADFADLESLDESQRDRLTELLDKYLVGLETGERLDVEQLLSHDRQLTPIFHAYLRKLESLYGLAVEGQSVSPATGPYELQRLGEFEMVRPIGRGGMGVVYEAIQTSIGRTVALKLLPWDRSFDETQVARFQNEARSAGLLDHPNIVPVFSVGTERGIHFFAMQLIEGYTLEELLRQRRESTSNQSACFRDWRTSVRWVIDVADALHHAHSHGVIHRDVKPSNLMLDADEKIWVTDFGLAHRNADGSLTTTGDMVGTMRYMSPEQASGNSALVDGRCDVYSLAVTLYELLTLRPAFGGDSTAEILQQITQHEVAPLRRLRPDLPRDLSSVIAKAMSPRRDDRYDTAQEFAEELHRVLDGRPTHARPPSSLDLLVRFAAQHRRAVAVMALFAGCATLGLSIATIVFASINQNATTEAFRAQRKERLARTVVDRLGAQTAELLADIPAAESVRRQVLHETLAYYEQLAADSRADPALRRELALTLAKIGDLQLQLGDVDRAIESFSQSESQLSLLVEESTDPESLRLDWSISQNNLGEALAESGDVESAARHYARAIKHQRELLLSLNTDQTRIALASTLNNLGVLLGRCDASDQALSSYQEALDTIQGLSSSDLQRAKIQRNLSGMVAKTSPSRAVELVREALAIQTEALKSKPSDSRLAAEIVGTLDKLGLAQMQCLRFENARVSFEEGIRIAEQLLDRCPDDAKTLRALLASWNHLGLSSVRRQDFASAVKEFESSKRFGFRLKQLFPTHAETQSTLANVCNNLGAALQRTGNHFEATEAFRLAVKHQSRAVRLSPGNAEFQRLLQNQQQNLMGSERNVESLPAENHTGELLG